MIDTIDARRKITDAKIMDKIDANMMDTIDAKMMDKLTKMER